MKIATACAVAPSQSVPPKKKKNANGETDDDRGGDWHIDEEMKMKSWIQTVRDSVDNLQLSSLLASLPGCPTAPPPGTKV